MSVARSSKCLFCVFRQAKPRKATLRRQIHNTPVVLSAASKPPGAPSQPATTQEPRSNNPKSTQDSGPIKSKSEKASELEASKANVAEKYTPRQTEAINAAKGALPRGKLSSAKLDRNPWRVKYLEDFTQINPILDKPVQNPWENIDEESRLKTDEEIDEDFMKLMENLPDNDQKAIEMFEKFDKNFRLTVGSEKHEREPRNVMAPYLPKVEKELKQKAGVDEKDRGAQQSGNELSPQLIRLMQMTGYTDKELRGLYVRGIVSHRVVNQTRLGKIRKVYWLSIAGNENGMIGYGEGKAEDSMDGKVQSQYRAIRNMLPILRYENRTIFGDVNGKSGATELELYARPPGFGVRCQSHIYEICRAAGIHDLAARVTRARNPMNTVKATIQALHSQKDPDEVARGRGKKMVDVRKVYYAGNV